MKLIYLTIFIAILSSSPGISKVKESRFAAIVHVQAEKKNAKSLKIVTADSLLIEKRIMHEFSQCGKKDEFYVCIKGKSVSEGKVIFKIKSYRGVEILKEEFPSYLLMDYGFVGDQNSKADREDYMKKRIIEFFYEKKFSTPAIKLGENFDKAFSNKEIWDDIKSDQTAIGFHYLIGEEDGRSIAFSKKIGKVVMYFNCC